MRILGLDPGSVCTGVGIIEEHAGRTRCLAFSTIRTREADFNQRLRIIFDEVQKLMQEYTPDRVAIERVFVNSNAESSLKLGHARGAAICAMVHAGVPISEYSPNAVKKALVGRGHADKTQVAHMVKILLQLEQKLPADAADALAVALCDQHHAQTARRLQVHG
ncbi:MAG: crossover junction endodeoxyribonuclease RuvC [Gammaproteobacteria bacterium]|jgi:crossover junction endodeoxyribonuclease RuvC|nr:crossover junction endodeoxyribonuclease RuvC [Gammaproteobacteria bacterium]